MSFKLEDDDNRQVTYLAFKLLVLGLLLGFVLLNLLCSLAPSVLQLLHSVYTISATLSINPGHLAGLELPTHVIRVVRLVG
jgi:hypothetical protein